MKKQKLNSKGFAHHALILGAVVLVAIGGVFTLVLHARQKNKSESNVQASSSTAKSKKGSTSTTNSSANNKSTASSSGASSSSTAASTTVVKKSNSSTVTTPTPSQSTSSNNSATTQTPLSVLTAIIAGLKANTGTADVAATSVTVAGPIGNATARPIVFTANGETYFAYTQGTQANFDTSAADTAYTMAITVASSKPATTTAHLDKANHLVDADIVAVGYSTGGN